MDKGQTQRKHFIKRFFKNLWSSKGFGWILLRILLILMVCGVALVMIFENSLIYFPSRYPEGDWNVENLKGSEGQVFPKIENVWLETPDGLKIHGWYCTPQRTINGQPSALPAP